jgi:hypothetical protein
MTWFTDFLGMFPLWALFLLTLSISVGQVELGSYLARVVLRRKLDKDPDGPLGALVGALLGLLAFILAFTFSIAAARFDSRKQLVLDEAAAVHAAYLRAELMPPAPREAIKRLLREYVDLRVGVSRENVDHVLRESAEFHKRLWSQVELLVPENIDGELRGLLIESVNEVIELHQRRVTFGLEYRVPGVVWAALYLLSSLSMLAVGYQVGMSGARRLRGTPIVAAAFALVIGMIADLDRPGEGLLRISPKPLVDVRQTMDPPP